mgnify:CR=1 FL=1
MNELSQPNGDYPLAEAVNAFFALGAEDQAALLALQPNDTGVATLAAQGARDGARKQRPPLEATEWARVRLRGL